MPISTSYPKGVPIEDADLFVGTKANNNRTVNYTAQGIANYLNINSKISIGGQISFKFSIVPNIPKTISFEGGGGNNTSFSAITKLIVSSLDVSSADITIFLNYLTNSDILLSQQNQPNYFGHYKIVSYTQIGITDFYELVLEFIGGNGTIGENLYYDIVSFVIAFDIPIPTLQQVLDNNHDLVDNNNFQGTGAGTNNTGGDVNAFGEEAGANNSGYGLNAMGFSAGKDNSGSGINAIGEGSAEGNTGNNINALGASALRNNTADFANAFGQGAGDDNTFKNVNLFGFQATADRENQNVFSKWMSGITKYLGRLSFNNITADRKWELQDSDGTLAHLSDIPSVTGFVPYTGATQDVDLGLFDITAAHLIKDGGVNTQFLKADGSVDNNVYLTSADLPSTLDLFATTYASDVPGYSVLVRNITDSRFNTVAVDVSTGVITTTTQLVGSLISDANIISGNPGIFNITTIGNISRTSGTGQAEFFFRVYKRDNLGVETFITESSKTLPVTNGGYTEFSATALWNDGIFLDTDRVVLKYYADRLTSPVGSNPTYNFQFGGISPVRSTAAIPVAVIPNIYLRDLADVENTDALDKEVLYWNNTASLWEHSLVIDLLTPTPLTSGSVLFSNGTTIAQDNANLFWDDTNNRLGIGTSTANADLTITKSSTGTVQAYIKNSSNGINADSRFVVVNDINTEGGFFLGSSTRVFDGNTVLVYANQTLRFMTNNTVASGGTSPIIFQAGGNNTSQEAMRITGGKTVLIGTTTDNGGKLQVKAPGALSTDIAIKVRNSADTTDLFTANGLGQIRSLYAATPGVAVVTAKFLTFATNPYGLVFRGDGLGVHSIQNQREANDAEVYDLSLQPFGAGVLIGTATSIPSSALAVQSTTRGFLPPRMTTTQKNAIATPVTGLIVYDTDLLSLFQYNGTAWVAVGSPAPVKLTSQTLTLASWTLVGLYYEYSFSNANIDTTSDISVTPQNASYQTAYNANVLPYVAVASGVATFYAQFPPQADIVVDVVITQTN
jgi:hypothetical protein